MPKKTLIKALEVIFMTLVVLFLLVPIFWIVLGAFKQQVDIFQLKFFFSPTLDNFRIIFDSPYNIHLKLVNSIIVSSFTVLLTLSLATFTAYSFSRFKVFAKKQVFFLILITQFIPAIVIVLPFFILFRDLGLLDNKFSLILINLTLTLPLAIWMLKSFIDNIPIEVEEAAIIDGSTHPQVLMNVIFPLLVPGLISTGIFCFILSWNEFIFALVLTSKDSLTLPVGLSLFQSEEGFLWNLISAAGILIMLPMFFLTLIIQKHIIKGISLGAVK